MEKTAGQQHQFYLNINNAVSPFLRRPHQKSRMGCANCKAGRIKCGEEKPQCRNCVKKRKTCQYQSLKLESKGKRARVSKEDAAVTKRVPPSPSAAPSEVSESFTLQDLRLFHHFLTIAHPSLPLGNESVWIRDIPQLIHVSDHLMHALLALGASHIRSLTGANPDDCNALSHRGQAIAGLKEAFAQSHHSSLEYDVMLATCYALAFQSALVPAGAVDFTTFARGCALITERIQQEEKQTLFILPADAARCPTRNGSGTVLAQRALPHCSHLNLLLAKGISSLTEARKCLPSQPAAQNFYVAIQSTFSGYRVSPNAGYDRFLSFYAVWFKLVDNELQFPTHSVNEPTQVLWAFFIGLQLFTVMLVDECVGDDSGRSQGAAFEKSDAGVKMGGMIQWFLAIRLSLSTKAQVHHLVWPQLVVEEAISRFNLSVGANAGVHLKVEALGNLHVHSHNVMGSILDLSASVTNWTTRLLQTRGVSDQRVSTRAEWQTTMDSSMPAFQKKIGQQTPVLMRKPHDVATLATPAPSPTDHATLSTTEWTSETSSRPLGRSCGDGYDFAALNSPQIAGRGADLDQNLELELELSILEETDLFHMHSRLDKINIEASGKG